MSRAARYVAESADGLEVLDATIQALRDGKPKAEIVGALQSRGVETQTAYEMVEYAQAYQSEFMRQAGKKDILWGFLLAAVGAGITYGTYVSAAAGESFWVLWGLILWGGFRLIRGFYRCVRYAVDGASRSRWGMAAVLCAAVVSVGGVALCESATGPIGWTAPSDSYITFEDESSWLSESQSLLTVRGTVRNTHPQYSIRSVYVEIQALSDTGAVLRTETVSVVPSTLDPGELGTYNTVLSLPLECTEAGTALVWEWVP